MLTQNLCNQARKQASGVGLILFIFLLTACGTQLVPPAAPTSMATPTSTPTSPPTSPPTETPTPQPTLTPTPTETPVPTPTPIPTLPPEQVGGLSGIPDPHAAAPELLDLRKSDAPIPQFVNAMEMGGIEVNPEEVANNLQYQVITGVDGKQYVIASFNLDPDPNKKGETLEGPIPLLIWSEGEGWREILFRDSKRIVGIHIGGMIEKYPNTKQIIRNFSFGTISSTWGETIAKDGVNAPLNFGRYEDFQINYANSFGLEGINGGKYYLNSVIFPQYPPQGFEGLSREEAINYLKQYITDVIRHFKSKGVNTFAVVNEPYHRTGDGREDVLLKVIGPDYVEIAFATARQVAPDAVLVLNETANHDPRQWGGEYVSQTRALIKKLREKGLVDWVGVQGHLAYNQDYPPPSIEQMERIFKSYEAPVLITEADFTLGAVRGQVEQKYLFQADGYYRITRACLNSGNCVGISFFGGFPDKNSWYEKALNQHNADPTPWADDSNPKPAYYAILKALLQDVLTSNLSFAIGPGPCLPDS